jgi:hypothetical protein
MEAAGWTVTAFWLIGRDGRRQCRVSATRGGQKVLAGGPSRRAAWANLRRQTLPGQAGNA